MSFTLRYHPDVRIEDLPLIDRRTRDRIRKAIEERLQTVALYRSRVELAAEVRTLRTEHGVV